MEKQLVKNSNNNTDSSSSVQSRYKLWRKYIPLLYDFVSTKYLDWSPTSIEIVDTQTGDWSQLLPNFKPNNNNRICLMGTSTINIHENDNIQILEMFIPNRGQFETSKEEEKTNNYKVQASIQASVPHDDNIFLCRSMPQRSTIVMTASSSSGVTILDFEQFEAKLPKNSIISTNIATSFRWSKTKEGDALIGGNNGSISLFHLGAEQLLSSRRYNKKKVKCSSTNIKEFSHHNNEMNVSDVEWHPFHDSKFLSCGQDGVICLWDLRQNESSPSGIIEEAHGSGFGVNCVSYQNENDPHMFLSGMGVAKTEGLSLELPQVKLWDDRLLDRGAVHTYTPPTAVLFNAEKGNQVFQVRWNPFNKNQFAAASGDGSVRIWDNSRIDAKFQNPDDALDGPPELAFAHGGHASPLVDFQWDPLSPQTIGSISDDNIFMLWRPLFEDF